MKEIQLNKPNYNHKNPRLAGLYTTQVDDEDYDYLNQFSWTAQVQKHTVYAIRKVWTGERHIGIPMHREILGLKDRWVFADHIDGNGLNNQKSNLRKCNSNGNGKNTRKRSGTTSKYKGVSWHTDRQKWGVRICSDGILYNLGRFADEVKAAKIYDAKAKELHGEFANLNFPNK